MNCSSMIKGWQSMTVRALLRSLYTRVCLYPNLQGGLAVHLQRSWAQWL